MSKNMKNILFGLLLVATMALIVVGCGNSEVNTDQADQMDANDNENANGEEPEVPTIPEVTVSFGHEPYGDHTQSIIGLEQGWFEEVGITYDPPEGIVVDGENTISVFSSGEVDVISGSVPLFLPASKQIPDFKYFFYGDLFQGYALMAQPADGYKSVDEFMDEGMSNEEAIYETIQQLKGKKFGYPAETAIRGFINLLMQRGEMTLDDVEGIVAEDSRTSAMMVSGDIDFQVGGVPSRQTLESQGFKPIITSGDLADAADPSPDSEELIAVFHDGWGATDEWIEENYETMLRFASVGWRINQFINDNQDEAVAIHRPFLNQAAGTDFEPEVFDVMYNSLHPFLTFEEQNAWFNDTENPQNDQYVVGAHIQNLEEEGYFDEGEVSVEDFSIAGEVYNEMVQYKENAEGQIAEVEGLVSDSTPQAKELLDQAKSFYEAFNYFDADRFSKAALEWAEYENE